MKFKNLKVTTKLAVVLAVIVLSAILNFALVYSSSVSLDEKTGSIQASEKINLLAQRIILYAQLLIEGRSVQPELQNMTEALNNLIGLVKLGGSVGSDGAQSRIPSLPSHLLPALKDAESLWERYEYNVNIILHKPALLVADSTTANPNTDEVNAAISFVESNGSQLLSKFDSVTALLLSDANQKRERLLTLSILFTLATLSFIAISLWVARHFISVPLKDLSKHAEKLGKGDLDSSNEHRSSDEIGEAFASMHQLATSINKAAAFAREIGKANFDYAYKPVSEHDDLGNALLTMREKLQEVTAKDKRRNWVTEGVAKFSEILRLDQNNLQKLCDSLLSALVKYMSANQGSLFVVNDDDPHHPYLERVSMYAWNKKKFITTRIEKGEGLIGQSWIENEMIYLKEIPEDYIRITSGLGDANPNCIIIMPLKLDTEALGVIELGSFKAFEEHEIEFLSKLSETLASTLSAAKINSRTKRLLEQSQQQAEELRAQEEEMRQNMEELQATQEEVNRKNAETQSRLLAIDESGIASVEFNLDGTIVVANDNFLRLMEYSASEITGKHHRMFVDKVYGMSEEYKNFWIDLGNGIPRPGQYQRISKSGKKIVIQGSYSVIRDNSGKPFRILKLANDVTGLVHTQEAMKVQNLEAENRLRAIDDSGIAAIEFNVDGTIISANENFLQLMGYKLSEIEGRHHRMFVDETFRASKEYMEFWQDLGNGIPRPGKYRRKRKDGKVVTIQGSYSIIRNADGKVIRIIKLANDITDLVQAQEEAKSRATQVENRLKALDESGIASIEFELDGTILTANENFIRLMGYDNVFDIVGKHHRIFVDETESKSEAYQRFWEDLRNGVARPGRYKRVTKNKQTITINGSYSILRDSNGKPLSVLKLATLVANDQLQPAL